MEPTEKKLPTIEDVLKLIVLMNNSLNMLMDCIKNHQDQLALINKQIQALEKREVHRLIGIKPKEGKKT